MKSGHQKNLELKNNRVALIFLMMDTFVIKCDGKYTIFSKPSLNVKLTTDICQEMLVLNRCNIAFNGKSETNQA